MRFITRHVTTGLAALTLAGLPLVAQTATVPQTSPAVPVATASVQPVPCVGSLPGISDAPVLLSHIEDILNDALTKTPVVVKGATAGTVGTSAAATKVGIDRDKVDEIRAEIAQLKVILKK